MTNKAPPSMIYTLKRLVPCDWEYDRITLGFFCPHGMKINHKHKLQLRDSRSNGMVWKEFRKNHSEYAALKIQ